MYKLNRIFSNEEGSGLVLALMVLLVLSVLGSALGMVTINSHRLADHTQETNSAYYIAEAGANMAYEKFKAGVLSAYETSSTESDFFTSDNGVKKTQVAINSSEDYGVNIFQKIGDIQPTANVSVEGPFGTGNERRFTIKSTGSIDGKNRIVEKDITVNWRSKDNNTDDLFNIPDNAAIIAKNKFNYLGGVLKDNLYLYSENQSSFVTSNMVWAMPEKIYTSYKLIDTNKNVFHGIGDGVQRIVDILYKLTTYLPPVEDKTVIYESYFKNIENASVGNKNQDIVFKNGEAKNLQGVIRAKDLITHGVNTINVDSNHVVLVVDNIKSTNWTTLRIKGEGSLTIYVKNSAKFDGTYNFDYNSDIIGNLRIIFPHKNQKIHLTGSGFRLRGQIIAPFSHIDIGNNPVIYGTVLANEVTINNSGASVEFYKMNFESSGTGETENNGYEDLISTKPATEN